MGKQKPLSLCKAKEKPFPKSLKETNNWDLMDWSKVVLIDDKKGFIAKKTSTGVFFLADSKKRVIEEVDCLHYVKPVKRF